MSGLPSRECTLIALPRRRQHETGTRGCIPHARSAYTTARCADATSASIAKRLIVKHQPCVAGAQVKLHGQWNLRQQQRSDGEASRELLLRSSGRNCAMSRRLIQLQQEPTRGLFTSRWSREMALRGKRALARKSYTPTCTASIEIEPPSTPSTGNATGSDGARVPIT